MVNPLDLMLWPNYFKPLRKGHFDVLLLGSIAEVPTAIFEIFRKVVSLRVFLNTAYFNPEYLAEALGWTEDEVRSATAELQQQLKSTLDKP